ncbi:MAG: ABC transporter permease [Saprospiraceae bacterium]
MLKYILRRILLALPTLWVISLLAFGLGKCSPGDPVVQVFGEEPYNTLDPAQQGEKYRSNAARLGLARPAFYFTLTTAAYPDSLWKIFPLDRRARLEKLIGQTGNWPAVKSWDAAVSQVVHTVEALPASLPQARQLRGELPFLVRADKLALLDSATSRLKALAAEIPEASFLAGTPNEATSPEFRKSVPQFPHLTAAIWRLDSAAAVLRTQNFPGKLRTPALHWHGFENQYHRWVSGFLTGDLGLTKRRVAVWEDMKSSLFCTLAINGLAMFLAYLMAVPLGVEMARRKGRWFDRWSKRALFFLYSMPVFWLGGMLILLFTNTEWGKAAIPSVYFDINYSWKPGISFGVWWTANASKIVLPVTILTLHALAVLALQMRNGMLGVLGQDYIRTARAKGVGEEEVYWSHALRNALFPIITVFASVLPAVFTGSLVVEALFVFPGIGTKTFEAYHGQDVPLLSAIVMVAATLTIVGSLLADVLYAWADPRVRFSQSEK